MRTGVFFLIGLTVLWVVYNENKTSATQHGTPLGQTPFSLTRKSCCDKVFQVALKCRSLSDAQKGL
jgi:hypothetical protein